MITAEVVVKSIDQEIEVLKKVPKNNPEYIFACGAIAAFKWVLGKGELPSTIIGELE